MSHSKDNSYTFLSCLDTSSSFDGLDDDDDFDDFAEVSMNFEDMDGLDIGDFIDDDDDGGGDDDLLPGSLSEVPEESDESLQFSDSNDLVSEESTPISHPIGQLEREPSMRLSDVFHQGTEATTTTKTGGLRNWLEKKLKDQEDNDGHRSSVSKGDNSNSESFRSHSESESQLGGANFALPPGGWVPPPPV
jgi:hypothetical protein